MTLDKLEIGKDALIETVGGEGALRRHFLDMGLTPGTEVTLVKTAPMGDPMELRVRGYELTLRKEDAARIGIKNIHDTDTEKKHYKHSKDIPHPQVGEMGIYHVRKSGDVLKEGEPLTFGLIGNQNCGKTTLFNQLTGSNQHVGNFPGVTVDRKDGTIKNHPEATVTDLPGIYSLSPYTSEEIVTRDFILKNHPRGIINIVDATNIERNLYLTMQLIEMDIPMVLALNMMDEVRENGGTIRINELENMLGIPVVPISAAKNEGISELVEHAVHVARYDECPGRLDFCDPNGQNGQAAVHRGIHAVVHLIEDHAQKKKIPVRFAATKLMEGDKLILEQLDLDDNEKSELESYANEAINNNLNVVINGTSNDDSNSEVSSNGQFFADIIKICRDDNLHTTLYIIIGVITVLLFISSFKKKNFLEYIGIVSITVAISTLLFNGLMALISERMSSTANATIILKPVTDTFYMITFIGIILGIVLLIVQHFINKQVNKEVVPF